MLNYEKIRQLPAGARMRLRSDVRAEYAKHQSNGFMECVCSQKFVNNLAAYGICDPNEVIYTRDLKRIRNECG